MSRFVNNIGHSWITSIELFFNDKDIIDQSTQSYAYKPFIENCLSYSNNKKESDVSGSYCVNDDDDFERFKRTESKALDKKRKLLEVENIECMSLWGALEMRDLADLDSLYQTPGEGAPLEDLSKWRFFWIFFLFWS